MLRDYQTDSIAALRQSIAAGWKRPLLYLPTGGGKSVVAVELVRGVLAKGKRVAFLVNRAGLVHQFSKHLQRAGIHHGILQGENTCGTHLDVLVCTVQTAARRGLPPVDVAIIDEAHAVAGSTEYLKLIYTYNNIIWIGLSATPFSKGLAKPHENLQGRPLFEELVIGSTIRDLISKGHLVDCDIYAPSEPDLRGVRTKRNQFGEIDFNEQDLASAVDKPLLIGDIVEHWHKLAYGKRTVVFATSIAHSKHIVDQFNYAGVKAEHIDCYVPEEDKDGIASRFESGETTVISNVALLREGWDVPQCECMILARPTKSLIAYIQMAGRILRPCEGKERAIILDHSGTVHRLGYPTDDLPLELCDGSPKKSGKSKEREKPAERPCPKCHFVKKVHVCPKCGFAPERKNEIVEGEGELKAVVRATHEQKQQTWSECLGLAEQRGRSRGWAAHLYKSIHKVFPRKVDDVTATPSQEVINMARHNAIKFAKAKKPDARK